MTRNTLIGLLAALAAALIGSSWQLVSRHSVTTTLGPLELAALRYGVPTVVLLPLLFKTGLLPRATPKLILLLLILGGGLPFGLVVLAGVQWAPAAHLGVFMAGSVPLFTAIGGWWVDGKRVTGVRLVGLALIVCGMGAFGLSSFASLATTWRGDLMFFAAAMLWAMYSLAFGRSGLNPWQGAAVVNAWSALFLLPILAVWGAPKLLSAPWQDVALQAAGQGVVAGLLGLVTYMAAIARLGAGRASLSAALVPLLTALGAAWLLREALTPSTLVTVGLVMSGVVLASGAVTARR